MMRLWTITVAAIAAFLVHSLAGYFEESSALHERSNEVTHGPQSKLRRAPNTRIDGTWLSGELVKIKSQETPRSGLAE